MLLHIDFNSETPVYMQIRNQIVLGIGRGELRAGDPLPTVRGLAEDAGVNAMTVNKAYALLKSAGFVSIDRRHGAMVSLPDASRSAKPHSREIEQLEEGLALTISEAWLNGVTKPEFMAVCERVYTQMKGISSFAQEEGR